MKANTKMILGVLTTAFILSGTSQAFANFGEGKRGGGMKGYHAEQKEENWAFRKSLDGLTPEQKKAAIKEHHDKQYTEKQTRLQDRLAKNQNLTDEQRKSILDFKTQQHQSKQAFQEKKQQDRQAFQEQLKTNPAMTPEQRKEAVKNYTQQQKQANQTFRQDMKQKREAFHQSVKPAAPVQQ